MKPTCMICGKRFSTIDAHERHVLHHFPIKDKPRFKFKIGDKVKIITNLNLLSRAGLDYFGERFAGKIFTIRRVVGNGWGKGSPFKDVAYFVEGSHYAFPEEALEGGLTYEERLKEGDITASEYVELKIEELKCQSLPETKK